MYETQIDLENVHKTLGMYVYPRTFWTVVNWFEGIDVGTDGGFLVGFREWLIIRLGVGNNLAWPRLVLMHMGPEVRTQLGNGAFSQEVEEEAINILFDLLKEFFQLRRSNEGLRAIYCGYQAWLERQSWYTPDSPQWIEIGVPRKRRKASPQRKAKTKTSKK